jgi:integrase
MHLTHPKYTYKKGNIYYFSKTVPADLQHHYRKNRLVCSLRTKSFHEAKFRSQSMKLELEKQWLSLRVKQDSQIFTNLLNKTHSSTCIRLKEALEYYLKIKGDGKTKIFFNSANRAVKEFIKHQSNLPLDSISTLDVTKFREHLFSKGLKTASVKRAFSTIRAIINFAISEFGLDVKNPFTNIYLPPNSDSNVRPAIPESNIKEIQSLCRVMNDDTRWLVALISDTGMRLAEAAGLLKSDLYLDDEIPHVIIQSHNHRRLKTNCSARKITLTPLACWALTNTLTSDSKYCFPRYNNQSTTSANSASATINKWLKANKHNFVAHSFRHSFRDRLRQVEAPTELIDMIGGWSIQAIGQKYGDGYKLEHFKKYTDLIILTPD